MKSEMTLVNSSLGWTLVIDSSKVSVKGRGGEGAIAGLLLPCSGAAAIFVGGFVSIGDDWVMETGTGADDDDDDGGLGSSTLGRFRDGGES